jgi:hypothetical protein
MVAGGRATKLLRPPELSTTLINSLVPLTLAQRKPPVNRARPTSKSNSPSTFTPTRSWSCGCSAAPSRSRPNHGTADFLALVQKQKAQAQEIVSCYEAGPTGFWLHRQLSALGVRNYIVCPTRLDQRHRGVANDRTDAKPTWTAWTSTRVRHATGHCYRFICWGTSSSCSWSRQ